MTEKFEIEDDRREKILWELNELMNRIDLDDPDEKDLHDLKIILEEAPEAHSMVFNLASNIESEIIKTTFPDPIGQLCVKAHIQHMRNEMGYENLMVPERQVIDILVIRWLRKAWWEIQSSDPIVCKELSPLRLSTLIGRATDYEDRFLVVVEKMARIRKLFSTITPPQRTRSTIHSQHTKVVESVAKSVRDKSRIDLDPIDPEYLYMGRNMWIPGTKDCDDNEYYE